MYIGKCNKPVELLTEEEPPKSPIDEMREILGDDVKPVRPLPADRDYIFQRKVEHEADLIRRAVENGKVANDHEFKFFSQGD